MVPSVPVSAALVLVAPGVRHRTGGDCVRVAGVIRPRTEGGCVRVAGVIRPRTAGDCVRVAGVDKRIRNWRHRHEVQHLPIMTRMRVISNGSGMFLLTHCQLMKMFEEFSISYKSDEETVTNYTLDAVKHCTQMRV